MNGSILRGFQLANSFEASDKLTDIGNETAYQVSGLGFQPRRSSNTRDRLHWSREITLSLKGDCAGAEGRLLVSIAKNQVQSLILAGNVKRKSGSIPIDIPIVGKIRLGVDEHSAVALVGIEMGVAMIAVGDMGDDYPDKLSGAVFVCQSLSRKTVELSILVDAVSVPPQKGRLLDWAEEDVPIVMA